MLDRDLKELPEFVVGAVPENAGKAGRALGAAATSGQSSVGRMLTDAVDRAAHTPESLAVYLSRRVYEGQKAHARSKYWWGRFYNSRIGENGRYIKMKGIHLIQSLNMVGKVPDDRDIPSDVNGALRLDIAEEILEELKTQLAAKHAKR